MDTIFNEISLNDLPGEFDPEASALGGAQLKRGLQVFDEEWLDLVSGDCDLLGPRLMPQRRIDEGGGERADTGTGVEQAHRVAGRFEEGSHEAGDRRRGQELSHRGAPRVVEPAGRVE